MGEAEGDTRHRGFHYRPLDRDPPHPGGCSMACFIPRDVSVQPQSKQNGLNVHSNDCARYVVCNALVAGLVWGPSDGQVLGG